MGDVLSNETIGTNEMCKYPLIVPILPQLVPVDTASQKSFLSHPCSDHLLTLPLSRYPRFLFLSSLFLFLISFVSPSASPEVDRLQLRFPVHCSH